MFTTFRDGTAEEKQEALGALFVRLIRDIVREEIRAASVPEDIAEEEEDPECDVTVMSIRIDPDASEEDVEQVIQSITRRILNDGK